MHQQEHIRQLLEKYRQQTCTPEELQELHAWLDEQAAAGNSMEFAGEADKLQVKNRIQNAVFSSLADTPGAKVRPLAKRRRLLYAAVTTGIILLASVMAFYISRPKELVIASLPGQTMQQVLPDGSTVWLNDNSELAYRSDFAGNRNIELRKGEAFFDVKKDPAHPFTVQSRGITTRVKGTSFSVKMINATGEIKVSVATGRVLVHNRNDTLARLLPRQRMRYSRQLSAVTIDSVMTGEANSWINGDLFLQNASLAEVIQWLQDHFNVPVYNKRHDYTGEYYLQVKRTISLQEIIGILNLLGQKDNVQFSLKDQTVIIQ